MDCGEPTLNDERCRSCDIEHLLESGRCKGCGLFRYNRQIGARMFYGKPFEHGDGCPQREVERARQAACGHFWTEDEFGIYCATCEAPYDDAARRGTR